MQNVVGSLCSMKFYGIYEVDAKTRNYGGPHIYLCVHVR